MTPDRTGGAGSPGWPPSNAIPGPPVPPAGAVGDASPPAPAGPQPTVGAVAPETSAAPAVLQGVWGCALTVRSAHFVPTRFPRDTHFGRTTGLAIDGFQALIDEQGLEDAKTLPQCSACLRQLRPARQVQR